MKNLLAILLSFSFFQKAIAQNTNIVRCSNDSCIAILVEDKAALKRIISNVKKNQRNFYGNPLNPPSYSYGSAGGDIIISKKFESAESFINGYAAVTIDEKQGILDSTGKMVIPARYEVISRIHEGLAFYSLGERKVDGIVDLSGKQYPLDPKLGEVNTKVAGVVMVNTPLQTGDRLMYTMKPVMPYIFSEGTAVLGNKVIDREGNFLFSSPYEIDDCKDGMFRIIKRDPGGQTWYGFLNKKGTVVVQPMYREAENYSNGRALVTAGSAAKPVQKYLDKNGKAIEVLK